MYVKAFVVFVNKRLKPLFLEQHINIVSWASKRLVYQDIDIEDLFNVQYDKHQT